MRRGVIDARRRPVAVAALGPGALPACDPGAPARAGRHPAVLLQQDVEHFGLLGVETGPWASKPPVVGGTVVFNLHKANERGEQDAIHGTWKIDTLIPR